MSSYLHNSTFKRFRFKPKFWSTLLTLTLIPILLFLGNWQLNRGYYKKNLLNIIENPNNEIINNFNLIKNQNFKEIRFKSTEVTVNLLTNKTFYLDNQINRGVAGYKVLTPAIVYEQSPNINKTQASTKHNKILLIDRGWIAQGKRNLLPKIDKNIDPTTFMTLKGQINHPSHGIVLKEITEKGFENRIQSVDYKNISKILNQELYEFVLQLTNEEPIAFEVLDNKKFLEFKKHFGYAFQWFSMGLAVLIYYLAISVKKIE